MSASLLPRRPLPQASSPNPRLRRFVDLLPKTHHCIRVSVASSTSSPSTATRSVAVIVMYGLLAQVLPRLGQVAASAQGAKSLDGHKNSKFSAILENGYMQ